MKTNGILTLALSAALAAPGCVAEDAIDDDMLADDALEVAVGTNDTSNPQRNAVVLITSLGCTGTLVAPDLVLTASHCGLSNDAYFTGGWSTLPSPATVRFGPDRSSLLPYVATATQVSAPPLPTGGPDWNDDIVLLRLTAAVPASVAVPRPVYLDHPAPLAPYSLQVETIYQIGYGGGRDRRIMTGGDYSDWRTYGSDLANNAFIYEADDLGVGSRGTNIENGDSGGPMTLNSDVGPVMGVLSHWNPYGIATYGRGGNGRPSIRDWLIGKLPTQRSDFEVVSVTAGGCTGTGGDPMVAITVRNKGAVSASAWVDVFTGLSTPPAIGTYAAAGMYRRTNVLAPEGMQTLSFAITNGFTHGWVDALVDTTRSLTELDETNNHEDGYVTLPDCSFN